MPSWNLWHGCHKLSEGCRNCYVYRMDSKHGKTDSFIVRKTNEFNLPRRKKRSGEYKLQAADGAVFTCMTSDFFVEDADLWRDEAWRMIRERPDLHFVIITKRIARAESCLPADWGDGYKNVTLSCTVENRKTANFRLPIFAEFPAARKQIVCEPLLEEISLEGYLSRIAMVIVGGESGDIARPCDFVWVKRIYEQCRAAGTPFFFKQTGAVLIKDGKTYRIPREKQFEQARKAQRMLNTHYNSIRE